MMDEANQLMERGWSARREGKYSEARQAMVCAIATLRKSGSHTDLVTALGRLGHIEMDLGRWAEAGTIYEEAISICRDAGDTLGEAHKTRHLGDVHRHAGRVDDARACYLEALSLYRSHDDPPKLDYANAIQMVALLNEEMGRFDQARALWMEAKELYRAVNVQEGVEMCSQRLVALDGD